MWKRVVIYGIFLSCGIFLTGHSQNLEFLLERYTGANAEGYVEPLVTAFGANLNSGFYRKAHVPKNGLHINLALNVMVSIFSNNQKTFTATTEGYFRPVQQVETPTIIGSGQGTIVQSPEGTVFVFPGGYELESFGLIVPTLTVGSLLGTEGSFRYFETRVNEDIGRVTLFGIGFRHSISQYLTESPVDISAGYFYHDFEVGDILDTRLHSFFATAGKSFSVLNLYSGLAIESNKTRARYTFEALGETEEIDIGVSGRNNFRFLLGAGIDLLMLHLNIDYNFGNQNLVNLGIHLGL